MNIVARAAVTLVVASCTGVSAVPTAQAVCPVCPSLPCVCVENSIVPAWIDLVGQASGVPDPAGMFTVTVKDNNNDPVPDGSVVEIRFDCIDVFPAGDPESGPYFPGMTTTCAPGGNAATPIVTATTVGGVATFDIVGSVQHRSSYATTAKIFAIVGSDPPVDLTPAGPVKVAAMNEDAVNGITADDMYNWLSDFSTGVPYPRSDFDHDGKVISRDLALFCNRYFAGSSAGTLPRCDGVSVQAKTTHVAKNAPQDIGPLRIAWNDCRGTSGITHKVFACNTNGGSNILTASVVLPSGVSVPSLTGFEAVVDIMGGGLGDPPLADWWRFDPAGCRNTALTVDVAMVNAPPPNCPALLTEGFGVLATTWPLVSNNDTYQSRERVRIIATANPLAGPINIPGDGVSEYAVFQLVIGNRKTVGTNSCTGCNQPVWVRFTQLKLLQGDGGPLAPVQLTNAVNDEPFPELLMDAPDAAADAFFNGEPLGVPPTAPPSIRLGLAVPSPTSGATTFRLSLPRATELSLAVYDIGGRLVRVLLSGTEPAGERSVTWDGRDDSGQRVRSGLFYARLVADGQAIRRSVVRLQ